MGRGTAAFLDPSPVGRGTPLPHPHPSAPRLRRLDLRTFGSRPLGPRRLHSPLATPSGCAPGCDMQEYMTFLKIFTHCRQWRRRRRSTWHSLFSVRGRQCAIAECRVQCGLSADERAQRHDQTECQHNNTRFGRRRHTSPPVPPHIANGTKHTRRLCTQHYCIPSHDWAMASGNACT